MSNKLDLQQYNPSNDRKSTAPYNFVPLPEKVFTWNDIASNGDKRIWETNDSFIEKTLTGEIEITATNLTPFYIRGQRKKNGEKWDTRDNRFRKEPYTDADGFPCIPGSSFRGMIRNIFEIITYSKISPVNSDKLFYRSVSADNLGINYRNNFVKYSMGGGYFYRNSDGSGKIIPCRVYRVKHSEIEGFRPELKNPNYLPDWNFRNKEITVEIKDGVKVTGNLVLTGGIPGKKHEFLFKKDDSLKPLIIPECLIDRFEDDDQITQWQSKAFPNNKPTDNCRYKDGTLTDGEAICYLLDKDIISSDNPDGIVFFGRAKLFRLPYDLSPNDLTTNPNEIEDSIDLTEGLFGKVSNSSDKTSIKSRVSFSDLKCNCRCETKTIVPQILSSPRPTAFQNYLVQKSDSLKHIRSYLFFDTNTELKQKTYIRGHKFYWHRWNENGLKNVSDSNEKKLKDEIENEVSKDKNHTLIEVVLENNKFRGRIRFNNLKKVELGALLSSIKLPDGCAHKIGMGKPLGLGSLKLSVDKLIIYNFDKRYNSWKENGFTEESADVYIKRYEDFFIEYVEKKKNKDKYVFNSEKTGLAKLFRIDVLYKLLNWVNRPSLKDTQYQNLDEFRKRKILNTPYNIFAEKEPFVVNSQTIKEVKELERKRDIKKTIPEPEIKAVYDKLRQNFDEEGYFKLVDGKWVARFEPRDERDGEILNKNNIPSGITDGTKAIFRIREMKKSSGLRVVFIDLKKGK